MNQNGSSQPPASFLFHTSKPNTMKQINNTDAAVLASMFIMAVVTICIIL